MRDFDFQRPGKASFIIGGQFGSCGKGAAAAWVALRTSFHVFTTNAGCQSGHTSIHEGIKKIAFHLPTAALIPSERQGVIYLNAGAILDPDVLLAELAVLPDITPFFIHPNAAIVTDVCRAAENRADSAQTRIASTRKGVGEALSRKVLRCGLPAHLYDRLMPYVKRIDLNESLAQGSSVLVEVPQGLGLSLNSPFYPHVTSRDCTIQQAMNDAAIHPAFMGNTMLVLRTFPIRVGNIGPNNYNPYINAPQQETRPIGWSGPVYPGQNELTWEQIGVEPEITTVTKRVRRVFDWSHTQTVDTLRATRPEFVFLTHVDYLENWHLKLDYFVGSISRAARQVGIPTPRIIASTGPTTADVFEVDQ